MVLGLGALVVRIHLVGGGDCGVLSLERVAGRHSSLFACSGNSTMKFADIIPFFGKIDVVESIVG